MIAIIHTSLGNFKSVANALQALGQEVQITDSPDAIKKASRLILPGVGSYGPGVDELKAKGLDKLLKEEVLGVKKKPFLGICLGMQLLSTTGEEGGHFQGLNWIQGDVKRLDDKKGLRLPHVGWNDVAPVTQSRLFQGISGERSFYFVHSYHFKPVDASVVAARCEYGESFVSAIEKDNVAAVQFHPEKSQENGLKLLKNFLEKF